MSNPFLSRKRYSPPVQSVLAKAVAAAQATANAELPNSTRGAASGVAPLDAAMHVPIGNIPLQTGSATLVAGTKTIAANVTASSVIWYAPTSLAGTIGALTIKNRVNGTPGSFDIVSVSALDLSIVTWVVLG